MTGYKSKKAAGLDEEGMYLVHHTKRKDDIASIIAARDILDAQPVPDFSYIKTLAQPEVLKLALEALEAAEIDGNCEYGATEIIRKALAQPPQREWVDLIENEIEVIEVMALTKAWAIRMTMAQLKERNT